MKLDVSDALYDSSSSVSTDSGASQSSRVSSHDFLSSIANNSSATLPSNNLVSHDGLHSGVPTRTTPTLTPTTLRSIEQFFELPSESASHSREAGFVPPLVEPSQPTPAQTQNPGHHHNHNNNNNNNLNHQQVNPNGLLVPVVDNQQQSPTRTSNNQSPNQPQQTRRNMGGRRPTRTVGMSPEEEERRQVRRERNKMAAARCRKRRMDHTNALLEETEGLEQKKQNLQDEITQLRQAKDELEFILEAHRAVCRLRATSPPDVKPDIKPIELQPSQQQQHQQQQQQQQQHQHQHQQQQSNNDFAEPISRAAIATGKPNRPNSLPIFNEPKERPDTLQFKTVETPAFMKTVPEVAGVPITTPSSGIPFNFESLMEGGTGLTPVSTPLIPSCSSQQRSNLSAVDLSSPDANPPKLVSL
ncbi:transcription factor kayak isoform X2 [Neodiprion virginianus]|uniref:transcription factor kayak isoform X2 n=1 Tax=Neodiprion virginianus TaxID=2961670 RepID=UPI001EE6ECD8|nr:transcription factor kayak isoform X2 [Neodiprion virginianus]XP_046627378.1 transcription factor kayak isoform X2 [Neodiprion virginianus]